MNSLDRLTELTNCLEPPLTVAALASFPADGAVEYRIDGTCIGFNLWNENRISVQRCFLSSGAVFPEHSHKKSAEWLIVYTGMLRIRYGDDVDVMTVSPGECSQLAVGQLHTVEALEDTWMIAVTVPADPGYPTGGPYIERE